MRMDPYFQTFMRDHVNIDKSRLESLDRSVEAIYSALLAGPVLGPLILDKIPQGSWAQRTIIKPVDGREFDADFMLVVAENPDWSEHPARYIDELHAALSKHGTYNSMITPPKRRCVRVVYAGDYHIDIVPFLVLGNGRQVIVNREENEWEDTNPQGLTEWFAEKDAITRDHLREVIRLVKYLRDDGGNFLRTRSVLLTAMLGEGIDPAKVTKDPGYYEDLPTTFYHVILDLNNWLQENRTKPSIVDPSGACDPQGNPVTFDHRWNEADYQNFRDKMKKIAADVRAAYEATTEQTSLELWQKVFGSEFKKPEPNPALLGGTGAAGAIPSVQSGRSG